MYLCGKEHDPLAVDEDGLIIPGNLSNQLVTPNQAMLEQKTAQAYMFLQKIALLRIRMLGDREAIELMRKRSTEGLSC